MYDIIDKFVPVKAKCPVNRKVMSRKYPKHIIRTMRTKAALWRRYSHSKTSSNKTAYYMYEQVGGLDSQVGSVVGQSAERPGFDSRRRISVGHRWNL